MNSKAIFSTRVLLGLIFSIFGLNGLLFVVLGWGFIPMPPPPPEMMPIFTGFMATHYLMQLVKVIEISAGLMLLGNRFVNLALFLLGPIVVNILCIHIFADRQGLPMAVLVTGLFSHQIYARWNVFRPFLTK